MSEQQQPFRGVGGDGISSAGATDEEEIAAARIANRFDIRRIIGGVFVLYGAILTIVGIFGSEEVKNKAAGINVNLWTGLAMLVVGALMIFWALARPVAPTPEKTGRIRRSAAT
jgi:ABC-type transport system involved in multi-copper enzyme maturation permease subunit